jgi:hypothetical protein
LLLQKKLPKLLGRCYHPGSNPKEPKDSIQPMTDQERQRAMDFIVEQQAKLSVNHQKSDERLSRLERIVKLMISAGRRTRRHIRDMDERFEQRFAKLTDALTTLAEAQTRTEASIGHTDKRLDALIDIVREGRNGRS